MEMHHSSHIITLKALTGNELARYYAPGIANVAFAAVAFGVLSALVLAAGIILKALKGEGISLSAIIYVITGAIAGIVAAILIALMLNVI